MSLLIRQSRVWSVVLLLLLGVVSLPASPVAAANCSAPGPGAYLAGCDLSGLDLSGIDLSGANLRGADLTGAILDGANLSGANLSNATLTEGALDTANTGGANLRGIEWVSVPRIRIENNQSVGLTNVFEVTGSGFTPYAWLDWVAYGLPSDLGIVGNDNFVQADENGAFTASVSVVAFSHLGTDFRLEVTDGVNTATATEPFIRW